MNWNKNINFLFMAASVGVGGYFINEFRDMKADVKMMLIYTHENNIKLNYIEQWRLLDDSWKKNFEVKFKSVEDSISKKT